MIKIDEGLEYYAIYSPKNFGEKDLDNTVFVKKDLHSLVSNMIISFLRDTQNKSKEKYG